DRALLSVLTVGTAPSVGIPVPPLPGRRASERPVPSPQPGTLGTSLPRMDLSTLPGGQPTPSVTVHVGGITIHEARDPKKTAEEVGRLLQKRQAEGLARAIKRLP